MNTYNLDIKIKSPLNPFIHEAGLIFPEEVSLRSVQGCILFLASDPNITPKELWKTFELDLKTLKAQYQDIMLYIIDMIGGIVAVYTLTGRTHLIPELIKLFRIDFNKIKLIVSQLVTFYRNTGIRQKLSAESRLLPDLPVPPWRLSGQQLLDCAAALERIFN